jgi:hypothetical protein
MSTGAKIGMGVAGLLLLIIVSCLGAYFSAATNGNETENQLEAVWEDNENIYSAMASTISEMAQVPAMAVADQKDLITAALDSRYGDDGLKATWAWIKEQNPSVDKSLYRDLTQTIKAKRTEFKVAQTRLIDIKRGYKNDLGNPWSGMWLGAAGYPNLNFGYPRGTQDDFEVVTSGKAKKAFETGIDEGITLRK